jgi:hypothetical protein
MKSQPVLYLPPMFATCMLFMTIYSLCVVLWVFFPDLPGHAMLETIFPGFKLLDFPSFCYGLVMSAIYGWFVAIVFVFFYNLWPRLARTLFGK